MTDQSTQADMRKDATAGGGKKRLREFYQSRRPEFFSDSEIRYEVPLTRELFDLQLARLSTDKKHSEFEKFVVAVSRRLITPNIKPQTGPDGGGDGKVDAETYEVSDDISDKWYSEECGAHGKEKWAFTISCRSSWKEKIKSDVKKAVETGRGYARVLCFSNQLIKADLRLALEESLSKQYDVKVDIFDATWCRDAVFQNGCIDVALAELGFSDEYKRKTVKVGNRDFKRKQRLEEIEKSILRPIEGLDTGYVDELDEACILSRALDMPRVDVEGKFDRAVRECKRHGTEPQLFNIIYNHAWTSLFWFEDCQAAFEDYNKLKPFVEADSSVARIEKLTNLLTVLTAASRMSVTSINLSAEKDYVKNLKKIVEQDPNRQSCALFLKLQDATQRLIWETRDEKSLIEHLEALRPLLQAASMNLEIGFESHYDILKEMSDRFGGTPAYEEYLDELADVIARRDSEVAAAHVRFDRAKSHFDAGRWKEAIKQLGFCLYAFEKESCWDELIQSSGIMGLSLWEMRLPYSAEAYLVKAVFFLVKEFRSTGEIRHLLVSTLAKLCEIELFLGRLVMYFNWRYLLNIFARNSSFDQEPHYVEQMNIHDASWICRFSVSDMKDPVLSRMPDILNRHGLYMSGDYLKYSLGYAECVNQEALETFKQLHGKFEEQPVFDQFIGETSIAQNGLISLKTTVKNFTFCIEYENGCLTQQVAELFLASLEALMATYDEMEVVPRIGEIKIQLVVSDDDMELKPLEADDEYMLKVNRQAFDGSALWDCLAKFIAHLFSRNAVHQADVTGWFEKKCQGERMMDRVSVLQRTHIAVVGVLGESFRYKIDDWVDSLDKVYRLKCEVKSPPHKDYVNREQRTTEVFTVSRYSGAWEKAGWLGAFFLSKTVEPPIFALVFRDVDVAAPIIEDWCARLSAGGDPIKIFIIRGINADHPLWYRIGIIPGDIRLRTKVGQYLTAECKRHTLMPTTHDHLNVFEQDFKKFGICWLTACEGDENSGGKIPDKFSKAIRFSRVEFKDAWEIGNSDEACFALGPEDNPVIPKEHVIDAPVLAVMERHRRFSEKNASR